MRDNATEEVIEVVGPMMIDRDAVAELCRRHGVRRLAVFGSATTPSFDPDRSDVDFLVEFLPSEVAGMDDYFGLKQELEELLGRPVDLVSPKALDNPYFAAEARRTEEELYAA